MRAEKKPLVSFVLFAYNQESYIREAVSSALSQTYQPLEIILSDDGSSDRTFQIIQEMASAYVGPHTVIVRQSSPNAGFASHVNAVASIATGEFIVLAAGDDISKPERTAKMVQEWQEKAGGSTAALYSDFEGIDQDGHAAPSENVTRRPPTIHDVSQGRCNILGATSAYTRDVFDRFLPLNKDVRHEDRVLPFRAQLIGGSVLYIDQKLVRYRVEGGVSRSKPQSVEDFLGPYTMERHLRGMPDAIQRLDDLNYHRSDKALAKECQRTIQNHKAMIALIQSKPLRMEGIVLSQIMKGAKAAPLLKHYAKMRMRTLLPRRP